MKIKTSKLVVQGLSNWKLLISCAVRLATGSECVKSSLLSVFKDCVLTPFWTNQNRTTCVQCSQISFSISLQVHPKYCIALKISSNKTFTINFYFLHIFLTIRITCIRFARFVRLFWAIIFIVWKFMKPLTYPQVPCTI